MPTPSIRKNSLRAWILACRPKTLTAALIPVVTASALAASEGVFRLMPALLCLVFAALMQVAANFANDYIDFRKGTDGEERLGPERACAQGWISPRAMLAGIVVTLVAACAVGSGLLAYGGWWLIGLGAACVVFAILYSTLLSYCGLGDVLVWVFFGFVPVIGTYYVQAGRVAGEVWWLAAGIGLVTDTLLVLNNYRDRDNDRRSGKRTIVVALGERFGSAFYLGQGYAGAICVMLLAVYGHKWLLLTLLPYFFAHTWTWRTMVGIHHGRALNRVLGLTSRNMLLFAVLTVLGLFLSGVCRIHPAG